jgi:hypothetical protein
VTVTRYKLDLVGVQEVRWEKRGIVRAVDYIFVWKRKRKSSTGNIFFVHHRTVSAVKRVEFIGGRMSYIVLRGHWCNIVVLYVLAPSEEQSDDSIDKFL